MHSKGQRLNPNWANILNPLNTMRHTMTGILSWLSPYANLGNIYRIRHRNDYNISMPRLLRRKWITNPIKGRYSPTVRFIVGECSSIQNVQEALSAGYNVEIITGPKVRYASTRQILAELLESNREKLKIFSVRDRPKKHSCLINGNILYEDFHVSDDDYNEATVVENVDETNLTKYIEEFESLKKIAMPEDTAEKILKMETIH